MKNKHGLRTYIGPKRILVLIAVVLSVAFLWNCYRTDQLKPDMLSLYVDQHPARAIVIFLLIYSGSVMALLPTLPLNIAAGFFWGGIGGGVLTSLGVTLGGFCAFMSARWLFGQPLANRFGNDLMRRIETEFDKSGWKFVAFARVNPIVPTGPLNYLLGLTSISGWSFTWSTFLFLLPPSIAVAYVGDIFQTLSTDNLEARSLIEKILIVSLAMAILMLIKFISKLQKK